MDHASAGTGQATPLWVVAVDASGIQTSFGSSSSSLTRRRLSFFLSFLHTSWRKQSLTQEVDLCDLGAFLSAPTSRKMCNTQSVQDDQQFQIVPLAICLSSFWSSYEYHILY